MSAFHILLAVLVAVIWGFNFIAIKVSYNAFPPFLLLTIRFILSSLPFICFIPKPKINWHKIILIGGFLWIGQFSFMFLGIYLGAPAGIASLLLQDQIIFTLMFSMLWLNYKPHKGEILGIIVATVGIVAIVYENFNNGSMLGILVTLPAGACLSVANILINKYKTHNENPLSIVVWSSLIPPIPLLIISLCFEDPQSIFYAWQKLDIDSVLAVIYTVYISTLIAASMWAYLMQKNIPSVVVPYSLLIPIFGMLGAYCFLQESYSSNTMMASVIVISGLFINQMSRRKIPGIPLKKEL